MIGWGVDLLGLDVAVNTIVLILWAAREISFTEVVSTSDGEVGLGILDLRGAGGGGLWSRKALDLATKFSDTPGRLERVVIGRRGGLQRCCSLGGSSRSWYCSGEESQLS